jgi:hypothetical protein
MRLSALAVVILAGLLVAGCASAVSPLYTKSDAVNDPSIVGTWGGGDKDNQGTVRIERVNDGSYLVTVHHHKSGDDAIYEAHLVQMGGASLADLLLATYRHAGQDTELPWGAVTLHEIVKYKVTGDDLVVSTIDDDALRKSAAQPGFPLQFRGTKDGTGLDAGSDIIIFSSTDQLRRYFAAHPAEIFGDPSHFTRQH